MRTFMHFELEAVVGRRRRSGDAEISLKPVKTRDDLRTLVRMLFPSVKDEVIDNLWTFMGALREYPVGDQIRLELSDDDGELGIEASIWDAFFPHTHLAFEEAHMPQDKFLTLVGMTFPHLPKESLEALWRGATALFKEIRGLGYERVRLNVGLEKESEEGKGKRIRKVRIKRR